jgi:hypothetical protein
MPGANCAFFGCPTSRSHNLALFKLTTIAAADGEHTKALKKNAREEWLRLVLRTREMTPDLKLRIEKNNIYVCELHFKPECIVTGTFISRNILCFDMFHMIM